MSERQGTHFFFMSFLNPVGNGMFKTFHRSGTFTPSQGSTRVDMFDSLLGTVQEQSPELEGAVVMSFDIQPNRIEPPTA
jgi:hypothetical protein